jgi:hypothetical protein
MAASGTNECVSNDIVDESVVKEALSKLQSSPLYHMLWPPQQCRQVSHYTTSAPMSCF